MEVTNDALPKEELIRYKLMLEREVDEQDLHEIDA